MFNNHTGDIEVFHTFRTVRRLPSNVRILFEMHDIARPDCERLPGLALVLAFCLTCSLLEPYRTFMDEKETFD